MHVLAPVIVKPPEKQFNDVVDVMSVFRLFFVLRAQKLLLTSFMEPQRMPCRFNCDRYSFAPVRHVLLRQSVIQMNIADCSK